MEKIFLDANVLIDIVEERRDVDLAQFKNYKLFISPLSIHVLTYLYKYVMPDEKLADLKQVFTFIPFDKLITNDALLGPTADFEDNVQLHSAANGDCNYFLTRDKKLLDMKFFGKTKIVKSLEQN